MQFFVYHYRIGEFGDIMEWKNSEFGEIGDQLVLPLFEGVEKPPNNSLSGLNRSQRTLVREAIASDDFEGKKGQRMTVWTPDCRVLLVGMGEKGEFGHGKARNIGARVMGALSKKKGLSVTVRFTSGWSSERMVDFTEGMMLRDYEFLKHQKVDDEHIAEPWSVDFQASARHQEALTKDLGRVHSVVGGCISRATSEMSRPTCCIPWSTHAGRSNGPRARTT